MIRIMNDYKSIELFTSTIVEYTRSLLVSDRSLFISYASFILSKIQRINMRKA